MKRTLLSPLVAGALAAGLTVSFGLNLNPAFAATTSTQTDFESTPLFARTATYPVYQNVPEGVDPLDETVAEISSVSEDGNTMIYTDAAGKRIGFLDISDPNAPKGLGTLDLAELGHADDQPTSVAVVGDYVLVVIDETGGDYPNPKGRVDVVRISDRERLASYDLGGQPDSIAISKDGTKAAIAMENQRDEDFGDGGLPQPPTGFVQTINLTGDPATDWTPEPIRFNDADGNVLPIVADAGLDTPEDLEPEYVSINGKNQLAVTFQENNGVAIIDLNTNEIQSVFSLGSVDLKDIDATEDGLINTTDSLDGVVREPDAVAWIDDTHFATANEGDWKGGGRGWSVFDIDGNLVWDAGSSIENLANEYGLHNEGRAEKKGPEIEGLATATMNGTRYAFVGSERSNFVAVYNVNDPASPEFVQILFTTNGPEGILPIESRGVLAISSEVDEAGKGVRSAVNLFEIDGEQPEVVSPTIKSTGFGWSALGALTADPEDANILYTASDSALTNGQIYTLDVSEDPALLSDVRTVMQDGAPAEGLDIEGLSARNDGGFWLASEGKTGAENRLVRTDADLNIVEEVALPEDIASHVGKWGLEGIDTYTNASGEETVYVALQRPLFTDPEADDLELFADNNAQIGRYNTVTKEWAWFTYPLESTEAAGDWIGLSELTVVDENTLAVIERDKLNGPDARIKRVMKVTLPAEPGPVEKELAVDALPLLRATNGWTQEKLEGFTIATDGNAYAITDNDAVDDATGETVFLRLGKVFEDQSTGEGTEEPSTEPGDEGTEATEPTGETEAPGEATDEPTDGATDEATDSAQPGGDTNAQDEQGEASADDSDNSGALPRTGVSVGISLAAAAVLMALGAAAVVISCRKKH